MGYTTGTKWDIDLVKEFLLSKGFVLIDTEYKDAISKLTFKDNEGYFYYQSISAFKRSTSRKFDKSNPYTIQNIKLWCKLNNKPFELISKKYESAKIKLAWLCLKENCGEIFKSNWSDIYSCGNGCGICSGMQVGLSNCLATKNPELAKEWHPTLNGDLTPYDVTCGSNIGVWWQCSKNPKHIWYIGIYTRTNGNGCPYCSHQLPTKEYNLLVCNPKLCQEWDYEKNEKKPEEYCPNSGKPVWWKCKECGYEWNAKISDRNNGKGCSICNQSKGERRIKDIFDFKNICYIPQKTFDGLIGLRNGLLSYDFYLPEYNLLIEYQGQQHEKFTKGLHQSKKDFEKQQEHDYRKREYANKNNIRLLEIWYWDFDRIEEILSETLGIKTKKLINK